MVTTLVDEGTLARTGRFGKQFLGDWAVWEDEGDRILEVRYGIHREFKAIAGAEDDKLIRVQTASQLFEKLLRDLDDFVG